MAFAEPNIVGKWRFLIFGCFCWADWDWLIVTVIVTGFLLESTVVELVTVGVS